MLVNSEEDFSNTDVGKEIQKLFNITVQNVTADKEKIKVLLAGGDLPDIVQLTPDLFKQVIEGDNIIPMDDLLAKNGQEHN